MKRVYVSVYPVLILAFALCFAMMAQQKTVKSVAPVGSGAIDGKSLYQEFCAVCHGKDARGNGPASSALKVSPGDLIRTPEGEITDAGLRMAIRVTVQYVEAWLRGSGL